MIGKVLLLNILGFSKLLFVSSTLTPLRWVYDRINLIIWPFWWGSRIETVALKSIFCPISEGDLGLREFRSHGQASRLSIICHNIINVEFKCFSLKYFCGAQLESLQRSCVSLRDNGSRSLHRFFMFPFYKPYGIYIFPPIFPSLLKNFILSFFRKYRPLLCCLIFGTLLSHGPSHWHVNGCTFGTTLLRIIKMILHG